MKSKKPTLTQLIKILNVILLLLGVSIIWYEFVVQGSINWSVGIVTICYFYVFIKNQK